MFEVERVLLIYTVVTIIVHHAYYQSRWQLTREEIFLREIKVSSRNGECLANHSSYWILCMSNFQSFCMSDEYRRTDFYFSNQKLNIMKLNLECSLRDITHQAE